MKDLGIKDLYNPNRIKAILTTKNHYIEADENQGFQEYPGSIELWQVMEDGRLLRVIRWLKKSICATY